MTPQFFKSFILINILIILTNLLQTFIHFFRKTLVITAATLTSTSMSSDSLGDRGWMFHCPCVSWSCRFFIPCKVTCIKFSFLSGPSPPLQSCTTLWSRPICLCKFTIPCSLMKLWTFSPLHPGKKVILFAASVTKVKCI